MEKRVLKYIKDNGLAEKGSRIGIAVSGGPDSMALLYCFDNFRKNGYFDICALHMEHGIRGDVSIADEEFVKSQCDKLKIPLFCEAADIPKIARQSAQSVETAAKQAREAFFKRVLQDNGADYVATAHHAEDNAESVLMHILRGCGINGLTGIKAKRDFLIRPFLNVRKSEIWEYIEKNNIPYKIDETNSDNKYTRNFVRNVLLKSADAVYGNAAQALIRLSGQAEIDSDFIEGIAKKAFYESVLLKEERAEIIIKRLLSYHNAISTRIIIMALKALGAEYDIEKKHIDALLGLAKKCETGKRYNILNGLCGVIQYDKLILYSPTPSSDVEIDKFEANIELPGTTLLPNGDIVYAEFAQSYSNDNRDKYTECFDFDKLPYKCMIRQIKYKDLNAHSDSDKIHPLGAVGSKKLNRYFTDKKVPEKLRSSIPLLADQNNIIWVIGHTISDNYKIDGTTKNIIQVKYMRKDLMP